MSTESPMVYPIVSWVRPSDWMLWMKMRDGQGPLAFTAIGRKLTGYKGLPNIVNNEVALNHPGYTVLPLLDDTRPNETAWTVFRNRVVAR